VGKTRKNTVYDPLPPLPAKAVNAVTASASVHVSTIVTAVGGAGMSNTESSPRAEGVFSGSLPESVQHNPVALRAALVELIETWRRGTVKINPFITTFPLDRAAYHWHSKEDNDLSRLLKEIQKTHRVRMGSGMDCRKDRGKPYFHVGYIYWA
jgi:hypothetical protein